MADKSFAETLLTQLNQAHAYIAARQVQDVKDKAAQIEADKAAAKATADAELQVARDAEIERLRQGSWVNYKLKTLREDGRENEILDLDTFVPATGWPPNDGPDQYAGLGQVAPAVPSNSVADTPMGQMLAALQARHGGS